MKYNYAILLQCNSCGRSQHHLYVHVLVYIYFACANVLLFLFLIHFIYLSAYSVIGLRLASRDTHYFLARDGCGVRKIGRKCISYWIPAWFGVLETIVSTHSSRFM